MVIYPNSWQNAGIYEAGQQSFGNWVTVFVIGCLLVCYALQKTGTIKRICLFFITSSVARKSPFMFTFMFILSALVISLFLDVTPAQFFILSIAHEMFEILGCKKGDRWPKYMVVMITFTCILGFAMTPICHTLPILWMSIYSGITGVPSNMLTYMAVGLPVGAIIWLIMMAWMKWVIKVDQNVPELENIDWARVEAMKPGKMEKREKLVVTISLLIIVCWLLPGFLAIIAPTSWLYTTMSGLTDTTFLFIGVALLAIIKVDGEPLLNLPEAFKGIEWLPVVLLAGIMMVASALGESTTGIPAWISTYVVPLVSGLSPFAMVALICVLCVVLTNIANNVPVGIIFVSVGVPMCLELGVNPLPLALAVSISANLAYTIPPAYIPVGVAYADPYCNGKTVLLNGIVMCVVSAIICALLIYPLANLFG
jgi:sodium-dependent dicarboxylate transporter 2/3/5